MTANFEAKPGELLREQMPICKHFAYFDHAAVAPLPACSAKEIEKFAVQACQQGDTCWPLWNRAVEELRGDFGNLLKAKESEIALVPNTTVGIGLIAEGWRWQSGDNVVVPANEFPSNLAPWRNLVRRGVEVREVAVDASGEVVLEKLLAAMDSRTRIVSVSWIGFASGWRIDVARFCQAVHQRGALLFLDAIQGLGAFPMDVVDSGVDFLAADGHKWLLGPEGAGVLFVAERHLERLDPLLVGWHSLDSRAAFDPSSTALKTTAARYEGGSTNMVGMLGLRQSVQLLLSLGAERAGSGFAEAILDNASSLDEALRRCGIEVRIPPARENRSGIVGIALPEAVLGAARSYCLERGIVTSVRAGRLRVSAHAYNNGSDFDRLVDALTHFMKNS